MIKGVDEIHHAEELLYFEEKIDYDCGKKVDFTVLPKKMKNRDGTSKYAYVMLADKHDRIMSFVSRVANLRKLGAKADMVLLITNELPNDLKEIYEQYFDLIYLVDPITPSSKIMTHKLKFYHGQYAFTWWSIINMYRLTQYDKVLYIGNTTFVKQNYDHIFTIKTPASTFTRYYRENRSGVTEKFAQMGQEYCDSFTHGKLLSKGMVRMDRLMRLSPFCHLCTPDKRVYSKMIKEVTSITYKGPKFYSFFNYIRNYFLGSWYGIDDRFRLIKPMYTVSHIKDAFGVNPSPIIIFYSHMYSYQYKKIPQYIIPFYLYWLTNHIVACQSLLKHDPKYNEIILKYINTRNTKSLFKQIKTKKNKSTMVTIREKNESDESIIITVSLLNNLNKYITHYNKGDLVSYKCHMSNCIEVDLAKSDFTWTILENSYNTQIGRVELYKRQNMIDITLLPLFDTDQYKIDTLALILDTLFNDRHFKKITVRLRIDDIDISVVGYHIKHLRHIIRDKRRIDLFSATKD